MKNIVFLFILVFALSGCASMLNVGESEYSCRGYPEGAKCISSLEIYKRTHDKDHLSEYVEEGKETDATGSGSDHGVTSPRMPLIQGGTGSSVVASPRIEKPLPVRSNAKVMRIYISSWVDKDGDLHSPGYVFTEIEPRRWSIGEEHQVHEVALHPLQVLKEEEAEN